MEAVMSTLLGSLVNSAFEELISVYGYKSEIEKLSVTISTIRTVLLDAEAKQEELTHVEQIWVEELKDAVRDADDLFDKLVTLTEMGQLNAVGNIFSPILQPLFVARTMLLDVRRIKRKLDVIARLHARFELGFESRPMRKTREETSPFVYSPHIVGRQNDVDKVVDLLLCPDDVCQDDAGFVSIVGVGGLGKTTLAQLVFQDPRIQHEFGFRFWVCVSAQDNKLFDLKSIALSILRTVAPYNYDSLPIAELHIQLKAVLQEKKFLLVLDDVWIEDPCEWLKLRDFFTADASESRVLVTSRSLETARTIGKVHSVTYELNALSDEDSWRLFTMTAFDNREERDVEWIEIGNKILKRCCNVPLAIKMVGTLLFGQRKQKWLLFQEIGLSNFTGGENTIISSLKLSYCHLESQLKSCFSYFALFPKDFEFFKDKLINLWMAQGYVVPLKAGQSIEDASEEYFSIFLQRCFFRDVKKDEYGDIVSCKLHDLMHDVAQAVAGKEICVVNQLTSFLDKRVRHLFDARQDKLTCTKAKIRTYLRDGFSDKFKMSPLVQNWTCLRTLGLSGLNIERLPLSIGDLLHLRYLDLSCNSALKRLPETLEELHNLQTLDLRGCLMLQELPKKLSKLLKLRHLDISDCEQLSYMPSGMYRLTCLQVLTLFVLKNCASTGRENVGKLADLSALTNLKGCIEISVPESFQNFQEDNRNTESLKGMKNLRALIIHIKGSDDVKTNGDNTDRAVEHKALLKKLQPHPNLRGLTLFGYRGERIHSWGSGDSWKTCLPKLVKIELGSCDRLQQLPLFSKLMYLKSLTLRNLTSLEYMENANSRSLSSAALSSSVEESIFFPSLENLDIYNLPMLKGWWLGVQADSCNSRKSSLFVHLSKLSLQKCPELTSFPACPSVETLCLRKFNAALQLIIDMKFAPSSSSYSSDLNLNLHLKLKTLELDNVCYLKSLPRRCLVGIKIDCIEDLEILSEVGDIFQDCSNLHSLGVDGRSKLSHPSVQEHLTASGLLMCDNSELVFKDDNTDEKPWSFLYQSLSSLKIENVHNIVSLPSGMQQLTGLQKLTVDNCSNLKVLPKWIKSLSSLQFLCIRFCNNLRSLPEEMRELTSLKHLEIVGHSYLMKRCRAADGEDWPKIQHIPSISLKVYLDNKSEGEGR